MGRASAHSVLGGGVGGRWGLVLALVLGVGAGTGRAMAQESPAGIWLTQDHDGVIAIDRCGAAYCGRIVGMVLDRPTDPVPTDPHGRSQCGLTIIDRTTPDGTTGWNTKITDPRDGSVWNAKMRMEGAGQLRVRGYILIPLFGRTQVWTPYTGRVPRDCRLPGRP